MTPRIQMEITLSKMVSNVTLAKTKNIEVQLMIANWVNLIL
jgi:hypothetical protein